MFFARFGCYAPKPRRHIGACEVKTGAGNIETFRAMYYRKITLVGVHFARAHAIILSLTPENQMVDFCKYLKNAKTNISQKHLADTKNYPLLPFIFFGLISNL